MSMYECDKCEMDINASCAKCDIPLVDDILNLEGGSQVQISKCPSCEGKIKSPGCYGKDIIYTV